MKWTNLFNIRAARFVFVGFRTHCRCRLWRCDCTPENNIGHTGENERNERSQRKYSAHKWKLIKLKDRPYDIEKCPLLNVFFFAFNSLSFFYLIAFIRCCCWCSSRKWCRDIQEKMFVFCLSLSYSLLSMYVRHDMNQEQMTLKATKHGNEHREKKIE